MQPPVPTHRHRGRAIGSVLAVLALSSSSLGHADVGSTRRPQGLLTFGPTFELDTDASMRFGGEVAVASYSGRSGLGVAAGFSPGRIYLEFQPAWVLGGQTPQPRGQPQRSHHLVLGLNPGAVVDVTRNVPCYGVQLTLWGTYARGGDPRAGLRPWSFPLLPFFRVQAVEWLGFVVTGGVMLKVPVPLS